MSVKQVQNELFPTPVEQLADQEQKSFVMQAIEILARVADDEQRKSMSQRFEEESMEVGADEALRNLKATLGQEMNGSSE